MAQRARVPITVAGINRPDYFFSLRLKSSLYIEPAEYMTTSRLLVISDIQGDFRKLCKLLRKNGVIDEKYRWIFEDGHLVILGNCLSEKSGQACECLWLIYSLEDKAIRKGGYVHLILGKNEIENLNGSWRNLHPDYALHPRSTRSTYTVLYDGNNELWRWLRTKNIMEKIGGKLFVHGGVSSEVNNLNLSITQLNNLARSYYFGNRSLVHNTELYNIFRNGITPFSYRGYLDASPIEDDVNKTLSKFGISTIVVGQPFATEVSASLGGKLIVITNTYELIY